MLARERKASVGRASRCVEVLVVDDIFWIALIVIEKTESSASRKVSSDAIIEAIGSRHLRRSAQTG